MEENVYRIGVSMVLQKWILQKGWTKGYTAFKCGVSETSLYRYLYAEVDMHLSTELAIEKAFDKPYGNLCDSVNNVIEHGLAMQKFVLKRPTAVPGMSEEGLYKYKNFWDEGMYRQAFAKNLRWLFKHSGVTTREMSRKLNVQVYRIRNWCEGSGMPNPYYVHKLCDIFGCRLEDLIG